MILKLLFTAFSFLVLNSTLYGSEIIGSERFHTVGEEESISDISENYDVPVRRLLEINGLKDPVSIVPGDKLKITAKKIVPSEMENGLIINLPEYTVYHFENGKVLNTYPIAIGKRSWQTPRGKFRVANKLIDPAWKIPPRMSKRYNYEKELIPPGPDNPLGKYWIGLSIPHIGLHSTNKPETVGLPISHGCMRMYTDHAETLYSSAEIGTSGEIIYEPVKTVFSDHSVYLEVHDDVYQLISDIQNHVINKLEKLNVKQYVDMEKVKEIINEKNGVPVNISRSKILNPVNTGNGSDSKRLWNTFPYYKK